MTRDMMQSAMRHAVVLGVFLIAKFACSIVVALSLLALLMTFSVPYVLFRQQRKCRLSHGNAMTYVEALVYGFAVFFYASLLLACAQFLFYSFLQPDYLPTLFADTLSQLEQMNMDSEMLDAIRANGSLSVVQMVFGTLLLNTICGFLLSLVTSFFVAKK